MKSMENYKIYQVKSSAFAPEVKKGEHVYCAKERLPKGRTATDQEIVAAVEYVLRPIGPRPLRHG